VVYKPKKLFKLGGILMQFNRLSFLLVVLLLAVFVQYSTAQTTISSNRTGKNGDYYYEYWKDNGTGTMTLGEGCNFSCSWGSVGNILFREGVRPGLRNQVINYSADYQPTGNSYLSIYGWFKNPLVEYYIIESWGTWKPPGSASKGTLTTDSGTYDIYQNQRTGPSIEGNGTFQQYWSVRKTKRTSGIITCGNHFDAWESKGMKIGSMYEVSFNVEAYQSSGGKADVKVSMGTTSTGFISSSGGSSQAIMLPVNGYISLNAYNPLGQKITEVGGRGYSAGQHSVRFNASNLASGVYYYPLMAGDR
jgi:endo-1,4-beta-xylanase